MTYKSFGRGNRNFREGSGNSLGKQGSDTRNERGSFSDFSHDDERLFGQQGV